MKMVLTRVLRMGISHVFGVVSAGEDLARGWGDSIRWLPLEDAMEEAMNNQKPMMVIVHKSTCPICARVKPVFAAHEGIRKLSEHFVMVNLEPDEVPRVQNFEPDGAYVPRFLFFNPDGEVYLNIHGDQREHRYFYDNMRLLESNMRRVLRAYQPQI